MRALITKLLACLFVCCFCCSMAQAQQVQWETVGSPSANNAGHTWVTTHPDGTPYTIHAEGNVVIRKLVDTDWVQVGPAITATASSYVHMVISDAGVVYAAFAEGGNGGTVRTLRFDEATNTWVALGAGGNILALDGGRHTWLAFDSDDNLYLTYRATSGAVSRQARVARYLAEEDQWVDAATGSLTELPQIAEREVQFTTLAFDKDNTAYLFYQDAHASLNWKGSMKKLVAGNTAWEGVGAAGFTPSYIDYVGLAIGDDGAPYVSFKDGAVAGTAANLNFISVMKYDETNGWGYVGGANGASVNSSTVNNQTGPYMPLVLDNSGMPIIFYRDIELGGVARRFNGTTWETVGGAPVTSHGITGFGLAIDKNTNTLYTSYRNADAKAEVRRFVCGPGIAEHPVNVQVDEGAAASLTIAAAGAGIAYQWQVDTGAGFEDLADDDTYSGTTTATLAIAATTVPMNSYKYRVVLNTDCGTATSNSARVSVIPAPAVWQTAGGVPASEGGAIWSTMDVDSQGNPYVLYNESGYKVRRLVNGAWEQVGGAITGTSNNATANFPYIRLDHNDVPYIAYQDIDNGSRLTVQRFNGEAWELVGSAGFSEGSIRWAYINFDNNNIPYVASRDITASRGRIVRFVNGAWEYLPNFLGTNAEHPTIAFDKNNVLYIGYRDTGKGWRGSVKKYNETTSAWEALGTEGFNAGGHEGEVGNIYLALDNNDVPHVLIHDGKGAVGRDKAAVMRYNGTDWVLVGNAGFSAGNITNGTGTSYLGFGLDNRPYVSFADAGHGGKGVFMTLEGDTWKLVGGEPATVNGMTHSGAVLDKLSGTMYLSYRNTGDGGKIYVRSFVGGPYIAASPTDQEVVEGATLTFAGAAAGTNLTYQWQVNKLDGKGFVNLQNDATYEGTTTEELSVLFAATTMEGYQYRMVASGAIASAATDFATLTVIPSDFCYQPAIDAQPVAVTICPANNATFTVSATGSELVYQWQVSTDGVEFTNIEESEMYVGVTLASLNIISATAGMNGYLFRAVVSGACEPAVTSEAAPLHMNEVPTITTQPAAPAALCAGANTSFAVAATGLELAYQWQVDAGAGFADISEEEEMYSGATTATLNVAGVTPDMQGYQYRVIVKGTCAPEATSEAAALAVFQPLQAGAIAGDQAICYNTMAAGLTNTAVASEGDGSYTYSWYASTDNVTWEEIAGANAVDYAPPANLTQTTYYRRGVMDNTCGTSAFTASVQVIVYGDLLPGQISGNQNIHVGDLAGAIVSSQDATGGNVVAYQWESSTDGTSFTPVANATAKDYNPPHGINQNTTYRRVATSLDGCGTVISNTVTVTVSEKPFVADNIPNVLFPNGSTRNSTWGVSHSNFTGQLKIRVFDRNGQVVFQTENPQAEWNGTYNGNPVPEGNYFYSIENRDGKVLKGSIKVIY